MRYDSDIHHRRSIRLKDYDYSLNGMYFITICTHGRANLFGEIVGADLVSARMELNDAGKMIESLHYNIIDYFNNLFADAFVIMPNHFHCIIGIDRADTRSAPTVCEYVQAFKSKTTVEYIKGVDSGIFPSFNKRVWQRNYYEHVIRNEEDYKTKLHYIRTNPKRWTEDEYY